MPIFAELKTDSGKVSSVQRVQLKRLSDLGQRVRVIYGISGICQFFGIMDLRKQAESWCRDMGCDVKKFIPHEYQKYCIDKILEIKKIGLFWIWV